MIDFDPIYKVSTIGHLWSRAKRDNDGVRSWKPMKILLKGLGPGRKPRWYANIRRPNQPEKNSETPVAVLVAHAFIGPRPKGHVICFKDGNLENHVVGNLEWITKRDAIRRGLMFRPAAKHETRARKRPVEDVINMRVRFARVRLEERHATIRALAKEFDMETPEAVEIVNGRKFVKDPGPITPFKLKDKRV